LQPLTLSNNNNNNNNKTMKLSEKRNSNFTPHPETDGPIKAVLVDITELKTRQTQYGNKDEFRLVFETECEDEENDRRFCIWSRGYTPSLHEKAALRKDLKKMMGRELTKAELDEFDLEGLIGHGVKLIIQHERRTIKPTPTSRSWHRTRTRRSSHQANTSASATATRTHLPRRPKRKPRHQAGSLLGPCRQIQRQGAGRG
jgi:hypothetical protein